MAIVRKSERAMVRAMCGAKLMEKKRTEDLMEMLGLKETAVQMAKANGVRWYGHVLRRDDGDVLRKALEFEVRGKRKPGQPKKTWKMQVEKESKRVGLEKKDAINRARWRAGVREIAAGVNLATPVYRDKPGSNWFDDDDSKPNSSLSFGHHTKNYHKTLPILPNDKKCTHDHMRKQNAFGYGL